MNIELTVGNHKFVVCPMDKAMTMGVVIDESNQLVLGWSRDDDEVHVLDDAKLTRWHGTGLSETLTSALEDLRIRSN